jgi:methionyl-tRNA formyltransferase
MHVVFAGTPEFSVPCLESLIDAAGITVVSVYSQPDRPVGRGRKLAAGPVTSLALEAGIPVNQPESLKSVEQKQALAALKPDLMVVVAYGLLLPRAVLDIPRLGCVNIHASLLPRWRGAAPIQRAIEGGDEYTGVTLMQMESGLDTGPVLAQSETCIGQQDTSGSLHHRLAAMGAELLRKNLDALKHQQLAAVPQDDADACYARKLEKSESALDFTEAAKTLERKIRAFDPWPGTTASIAGTAIHVHKSSCRALEDHARAGEVLGADSQGILVQTGRGQLNIEQLQRPGGKILNVRDFLNGMPITVGTVLNGR